MNESIEPASCAGSTPSRSEVKPGPANSLVNHPGYNFDSDPVDPSGLRRQYAPRPPGAWSAFVLVILGIDLLFAAILLFRWGALIVIDMTGKGDVVTWEGYVLEIAFVGFIFLLAGIVAEAVGLVRLVQRRRRLRQR